MLAGPRPACGEPPTPEEPKLGMSSRQMMQNMADKAEATCKTTSSGVEKRRRPGKLLLLRRLGPSEARDSLDS
jgi:hypothetical protein